MDCKGHTGGFMLSVKAHLQHITQRKINTKSSTETKLVPVDDLLGDVLWMRYVLEAQGYTIDSNITFQDNMSTLSLEKNGRVLASSRVKHIRAKYFLIKDRYDAGNIDLHYCPTEEMWADVLTKPLQGHLFWQMRAILINCPIDYAEYIFFLSLQ